MNRERSVAEEYQKMQNQSGVGDVPSPEDSGVDSTADGAAHFAGDAANAGGDCVAELAAKLEAALEESRRNHERYLRSVADLDNYRRRAIREKDELRQYAVAGFVEELLPVLDNLAIGLETADKHPEAANVAQGFRMVAEQIRSIITRNGVQEINPRGESFDPHRHEAVASHPHDAIPAGHVIHVVRCGYMLNNRLVRPATVVVSSGPPPASSDRNTQQV